MMVMYSKSLIKKGETCSKAYMIYCLKLTFLEMDILTNNFYLLLYLKATTSYQWCTAGKILKWFFLIFAGMSKVQKDISCRILFCAVFFSDQVEKKIIYMVLASWG